MKTLEQIMTETPVMPHSEEAEKLVLGTLLTEGNRLNDVRELLPLDAFYIDKHKDMYRAILSLADKGEHIACLEARKHFAWYLRGVAYSNYYKAQISSISKMEDIYRVAEGIRRDLK